MAWISTVLRPIRPHLLLQALVETMRWTWIPLTVRKCFPFAWHIANTWHLFLNPDEVQKTAPAELDTADSELSNRPASTHQAKAPAGDVEKANSADAKILNSGQTVHLGTSNESQTCAGVAGDEGDDVNESGEQADAKLGEHSVEAKSSGEGKGDDQGDGGAPQGSKQDEETGGKPSVEERGSSAVVGDEGNGARQSSVAKAVSGTAAKTLGKKAPLPPRGLSARVAASKDTAAAAAAATEGEGEDHRTLSPSPSPKPSPRRTRKNAAKPSSKGSHPSASPPLPKNPKRKQPREPAVAEDEGASASHAPATGKRTKRVVDYRYITRNA